MDDLSASNYADLFRLLHDRHLLFPDAKELVFIVEELTIHATADE